MPPPCSVTMDQLQCCMVDGQAALLRAMNCDNRLATRHRSNPGLEAIMLLKVAAP